MLKKTCAASGLLIATAAGAILTSAPAFAKVPMGGGGCCGGFGNGSGTHNRSWNGNENESLNHIRLRLHNRNNNIAVARTPGQRDDRPLVLDDDRRR
ncbi:hypothetical protein [Actinoallomurus acaciae]|uniref:Uncharacterized protein n=1 Tax=Actinoallomurus acaciae TaxID=502577 RepID=A0ABV5YH83_9ACTN